MAQVYTLYGQQFTIPSILILNSSSSSINNDEALGKLKCLSDIKETCNFLNKNNAVFYICIREILDNKTISVSILAYDKNSNKIENFNKTVGIVSPFTCYSIEGFREFIHCVKYDIKKYNSPDLVINDELYNDDDSQKITYCYNSKIIDEYRNLFYVPEADWNVFMHDVENQKTNISIWTSAKNNIDGYVYIPVNTYNRSSVKALPEFFLEEYFKFISKEKRYAMDLVSRISKMENIMSNEMRLLYEIYKEE